MTKAESFAMQYGYYDKEKKRACCVGYNAGYKQAEKDLALTIEDVITIIQIIMTTDWYDFEINGKLWSKEFYEEVLTRFKKYKEVKK